jgi:hypothetical protein
MLFPTETSDMEGQDQRVFHRIRAKLPELVIESVSVVLAVLLALVANEWRQNRANRKLADRALIGIEQELRSNLQALEGNTPNHEEMLRQLESGIDMLRRNEQDFSVDATLLVSTQSASAWQTAQLTGAVNHMDYAVVVRLSELYSLQSFYSEVQSRLVEEYLDMYTHVEADEMAIQDRLAFLARPHFLMNQFLPIHRELAERTRTELEALAAAPPGDG